MLKINTLSKEILNEYDIFFVDAYGVLFNGKHIVEGSPEALKYLVESGKIVFIVSNTATVSSEAIKMYEGKKLYKGVHFHHIITSGETANYYLKLNQVNFKSNQNLKKVWIFGIGKTSIFKDTNIEIVENIEDADFMYINNCRLSQESYDKIPQEYKGDFFVSSFSKDSDEYETTNVDHLLPYLEKALKLKLPVLNANPDLVAQASPKKGCSFPLNHNKNEPLLTIVQGSIAKQLSEEDLEVVQLGKPYCPIYSYCLTYLNNNMNISNEELANKKFLMIGDTITTDVLGAINAKKQLGINIFSMLTLTGVSYHHSKIYKQESDEKNLDMLFKDQNITPDIIVKSFSLSWNTFI